MSLTKNPSAKQFKLGLHTSSMLKCASIATLAMSFAASPTYALPTGAQVVAGDVTIHQPNGTNMVIDQATNQAITNWQGFDILSGEAVQINQPGAGSQSLNRVLGGKMTEIHGHLSSNGQVFIVNGSGVFFGGSAEVNVAGMVASTADISNADFAAGNLKFDKAGKADASIVNQGSITAAEGGLVAMIAPSVRNDGVIQANLGTVALAGAQTATVDMYGDGLYSFALGEATTVKGKDNNGNELANGVDNQGSLIAHGGTVLMTAKAAKNVVDNVVNNDGIIEATTAQQVGGTIILGAGDGNVRVAGKLDAAGKAAGDKGGSITVTGQEIQIASGADIDASGKAGGGSVKIGGDYQGGGDLPHADKVTVEDGAIINVSATENGDAGSAIMWSNQSTDFKGTALATADSGDGGLVEVSSKGEITYEGYVDVSSQNGAAGMLLLDPTNITITNLSAFFLGITLSLGGDVTISTPVAGAQAGNINVNSDITWVGTGNLILDAINNINVNNNILSFFLGNGNQGSVTLQAGNNINVNNNTNIFTSGGDITLNSGNRTTLTNSDISSINGDIAINNDGRFFSSNANSLNSLNGTISLNQSTAGSIQNAIDAVGAAQSAVLTLGAGTFDESFVVDQGNFTVTGQGEGVTFIKPTSLAAAPLVNLSSPFASHFYAPIVLARGANGINFSNFTVDATAAAAVGGTIGNAPVIYDNAGGSVNALTTLGGANSTYGVLTFADTDYGHGARIINIDNLTSSGNWFAAVEAIGNQNTSNVSNSVLNGSTGAFAAAFLDGASGSVSDSTLTGGNRGAVGFYEANNVSITGNMMTASTAASVGILDGGIEFGLGLGAADDITVTGNTITGFDDGILANGGNNWTVAGNTITGNGFGVGSLKNGILLNNVTGINLVGGATPADANTVTNFGTGIKLSGTTATVSNNQLNGNNTGISVLAGSHNSVVDANIIDDSNGGISVFHSNDVTISNNTLTRTLAGSGHAIYLYNVNGNSTVNNNTIFDFLYGVRTFGGSGLTISNGTHTNNVNGITLDGTTGATVSANQLTDSNTAISVLAGSHNALVDGNIITNANSGISAFHSSDIMLSDNIISRTPAGSGHGIYLYNINGNSMVDNNTISDFLYGVRTFGGSGLTISNGTLTNNITGITLDGTTGATVDSVTLNDSTTGIDLINGSHNAILNGNTISGATANGIRVDASNNVDITDNMLDHITTNTANGIFVSNADDVLVSGNSVDDTLLPNYGLNAVHFDNVTNSFITNNFLTYFTHGININGGSNITVNGGNTLFDVTTALKANNSNGLSILNNGIDRTYFAMDITGGDNIDINNNIITDVLPTNGGLAGDGIRVANASNVSLTGNDITGNAGSATGIHLDHLTGTNAATNNDVAGFTTGIHNDGSNGTMISGGTLANNDTGILINPSMGVTVDGVTINNSTGTAIELVNSDNSNIINNIIDGAEDGITLLNTDFSDVNGNVFDNVTRYGIALESSFMNNLLSNTINGPIARGIYVLFNGGNNTISGNNISNANVGIAIAGSRFNNINNNILTDNNNGITLLYGADFNTLDSNTIDNSGIVGIRTIASNGQTITNNTLTNVNGDGIHMGNPNAVTTGSNITGNGITAAAGNTTGVGIFIKDILGLNSIGDGTAAGSNTIQNFDTGIIADNTQVSINRNSLNNNANGIFVTNNSDNSIIARNNIGGTTGQGIHVKDSADILVNANRVGGNAGALAGIHLENLTGTNSASNNDVGGFRAGIWNDGSNGTTISGGTLANNTTGIVVNPSTGVTIDGVTLNNNTTGINVVDSTVTLNNNTINGGTTGLIVSGATSDLLFGATANTFDGQSGDFIKLINNGLDNTATFIGNQLFNLTGTPVAAAGLNDANSFLLEDKLTHASDANGLGLLWWNANNLYASGVIQPSIDAAKLYNFNQVNVNTGVYDENLLIDGFATGLRLTGGNRNVVIRPTTATSNIDMLSYRGFTHGHSGIIHIRNSNGINLDNLTVDGGSIASGFVDASYAGVVAHDAGVSLDDMTIQNIFGDGLAWRDGAGISTDSAYGTTRNLLVTDSTLQNLQNYGVIVAGADQLYRLNNNTIDMTPVAGHPSGYTPFGVASIFGAQGRINNNTISNTPSAVGPYNSSGIFLLNAGSTSIAGNTISDGLTGIYDSGSNGILNISGNTINSGMDGIFIDSHTGAVTVQNNTLNAAVIGNDTGVHLLNTNGATLDNNQVNNFNIGIHNDGSNNTQITNNTLLGNITGVLVNPSSGVTLDGNTINALGDGVQIDDSTQITLLNNTITAGDDGVDINNSDQILVGTLIDGNVITAGDNGVEASNSNLFAVLNNLITAGDNGVDVRDSSLFAIALNTITGAGNNGILLRDSNGSLIALNTVTGSGNDGIFLRNSDSSLLFANGTYNNGRDGVHIQGSSDILAIGNDSRRNANHGFSLTNGTRITLDSNTAINNDVDGINAAGTNRLTLTDNTANRNGDNGADVTNINRLTATGNIFNNNSDEGLFVDGINIAALISGNTANRNDGHGIEVRNADGAQILSNTTNNNQSNGLRLINSDNVTMDGNTANGNNARGFFITGSDDLMLNSNTAINNNAAGFRIHNSDRLTADSNTANNNGRGFRISNSDDATLTNNTIFNNNQEGILFENGDDAFIAFNNVRRNQNGIVINGGERDTVQQNTIFNNTLDGVVLNGGLNQDVNDNNIRRNGQHGIATNNTLDALIRDNQIFNNGMAGIFDTGSSDLRIEGNNVRRNNVGISLNGSTNVTVNNLNQIINNATSGIEADNSTGAINNNTINRNNDGVVTTDSLFSFVGNTIANNLRDGLRLIRSAGSALTGNTIVNNGRNGVVVGNSDNVTLDSNTINNNGTNGVRVNNSDGFTALGNTVNNNNNGFFLSNSNAAIFTGNTINNNAISGVTLANSSNDAVFSNNTFTGNGIGASLIDSDNATFNGDVFTSNAIGVNLNNSENTLFDTVTFNIPAAGTGLQVANGSANTTVTNSTFDGGDVAIRISDAGSSLSFTGTSSSFSNMNFYFVLENGAMNGLVLDASNQIFEGILASTFTVSQRNAAELKTIDIADTFGVGDVFYRSFPFSFSALDEFQQEGGALFRQGLFSYAGKTIVNDLTTDPFSFNVDAVNLSLLGAGNVPAGQLANLAPAAGDANSLANLSPAAGGNAGDLANLSPAAGGDGACGNSFLGAGFAPGFNSATCSVQ